MFFEFLRLAAKGCVAGPAPAGGSTAASSQSKGPRPLERAQRGDVYQSEINFPRAHKSSSLSVLVCVFLQREVPDSPNVGNCLSLQPPWD